MLIKAFRPAVQEIQTFMKAQCAAGNAGYSPVTGDDGRSLYTLEQFSSARAAVKGRLHALFEPVDLNSGGVRALRAEFQSVASAETANSAEVYRQREGICTLNGHCAAVAYVLQKLRGGELVRGVVRVRINGEEAEEVHYWNRLGGVEIDLTGSQYGGDGVHSLDDPEGRVEVVTANGVTIEFLGFKAKEIRQTVTYQPRFDVFYERFLARPFQGLRTA